MKIDRLLGITIYLLNHNKTSAQYLADKFEVSKRTIQRDMETLCKAGIPIVSTFGSNGGYEILETFHVDRQIAKAKDYSFIITALQGLATAYQNPQIEKTLEKILSLNKTKQSDSKLHLDFGVLRENNAINEKIVIIDSAMMNKKAIAFQYTNANDIQSIKEVEPVGLTYRWYSWYLVGYSLTKNDYRLYKLIRMQQINTLDCFIKNHHDSIPSLLEKMDKQNKQKYLEITLLCKSGSRAKVVEYLNGQITKEIENGDFIMELNVPENEFFWFGVLLALGNQVKVLQPHDLKQRLMHQCNEIISMYE